MRAARTKFAFLVAALVLAQLAWPVSLEKAQSARQILAALPAWFEPNVGLQQPEVLYQLHGADYGLKLERSRAVIDLSTDPRARVSIRWVGSNQRAGIEALEPLPGRTSYFIGARSWAWRPGVPHYARIRYRDLYPGIHLDYKARGRAVEFELFVEPGADVSGLTLELEGADEVRVGGQGELLIYARGALLQQSAPYAYQERAAGGAVLRKPVEVAYQLLPNNRVRLKLGQYDPTQPLVIDPILTYAGYFGGNRYEMPTDVTVDEFGYIWITGTTQSVVETPPGTFPLYSGPRGGMDVFVAKIKLSPAGPPVLHYWTYLGGGFDDKGGSIAVRNGNTVYLTGATYSTNFPVTKNAAQSTMGTLVDGFATVLDMTQGGEYSLVYSTFLGGTGYDEATSLFVAADGTFYVAGYGAGYDIKSIPETALQPNNRGGWDAWVFHLDPYAAEGGSVLFSTYYGGGGTDVATGVVADKQGNIYLVGYTMSAEDFPIEGDWVQGVQRGPSDVFIVKIDPSRKGLDRLVYGTFFGGSGGEIPTSLRMDPAGRLWISGYTTSRDFPVTDTAEQSSYGGGQSDGFLLCFDPAKPSREAICHASYLGGSKTDVIYDLELLPQGQVAFVGYTESDDIQVVEAPAMGRARTAASDAWIGIVDPGKTGQEAMRFSTYYGGTLNDVGIKIVPFGKEGLLVVGYTSSADLAVTDGSHKPSPGGGLSGFLLRLEWLPGEYPQEGAPSSLLPTEKPDGVPPPLRRTTLGIESRPRGQTR